jgi:transcriptional regulator with GAF, ATPase, and Fis domain
MNMASIELEHVLYRVADLARQTIHGAAEVSVTLVDAGRPFTVASTGQLAGLLDEAQYGTGQGPCLHAANTGQTVVIHDMESEDRWPDYTRDAFNWGAHSLLTIGLPIQKSATGALNVYGTTRLAFDPAAVLLAEGFTGYVNVALTNAYLYQTTARVTGQMQAAMQSRAGIEQAKGIIVAQRHCPPDEAFTVISRLSHRTHRKLRDVATDIVSQATNDGSPV